MAALDILDGGRAGLGGGWGGRRGNVARTCSRAGRVSESEVSRGGGEILPAKAGAEIRDSARTRIERQTDRQRGRGGRAGLNAFVFAFTSERRAGNIKP